MRFHDGSPPCASPPPKDAAIEPVTAHVTQQDRETFARLYRQYRQPIYRYLRARTPSDRTSWRCASWPSCRQ